MSQQQTEVGPNSTVTVAALKILIAVATALYKKHWQQLQYTHPLVLMVNYKPNVLKTDVEQQHNSCIKTQFQVKHVPGIFQPTGIIHSSRTEPRHVA